MDMSDVRAKLTARLSRDDGMSLVEVMVSMIVIGIVFSALAGVMAQSLIALSANKDFQTATQLTTQRLEQVRALAFGTIQAGVSTTAVAAAKANGTETRLTGTGPYYFEGERLLTHGSSTSTTTPLSPYRTTTRVDNIDYTLATYPTECWQPRTAPGTCTPTATNPTTDESIIRITVVADWTPPGSTTSRTLRNQSLAYSPDSCLANSTHPFSAPCQPFFYSNAGAAGGSVVIAGALEDGAIVHDGDASAVSLALPSAGTSLQVEQTATIKAAATGSTITVDNDENVDGAVAATSQATDDPSGGSFSGVDALSASAVSRTITGNAGSSMVVSGAGATGSATAVAAATSSPACLTAAGATSSSGRPCASAAVTAVGSSGISLTGTSGGVSLATTVVSVAAGAQPSRAHSGSYTTAGTLCTGVTTPGCVVGDSHSETGAIVIGGLPAGVTAPSGWLGGAVLIDATTMNSAAERGLGAAAPAAPSITGSPTLRVWNGTGYTSFTLSSLSAGQEVVIAPVSASAGSVEVALAAPLEEGQSSPDAAGTVNVAARAATTNGPTNCSAECSAAASTAGITVTIHYQLTVGGDPSAAFSATATIDAITGSATFEPAPDSGGS